MSDFAARFGGVGRLYGAAAGERLRQSHVGVIGVGGVCYQDIRFCGGERDDAQAGGRLKQ